MKKVKEFDFPLSTKIAYASVKEGEEVKGSFIKLTPPSSKQLTQCAFLKQSFIRAVTEQSRNNPDAKEDKDSEAKISGQDIIYLLYGSESVDMAKILLSAIELFKSGVAMIDGETKVTKPILEEISNDDLEGMLGEYLANFTLRSVLNQKKRSS